MKYVKSLCTPSVATCSEAIKVTASRGLLVHQSKDIR